MEVRPRGYPRLAALMSEEKDVAIFRRFDDLNFLNLLALQAEIVDLEKDFRRECRINDAEGQIGGAGPSNPASYVENFKLSKEQKSAQYRFGTKSFGLPNAFTTRNPSRLAARPERAALSYGVRI
jgi:hypothetical protein